MGEFRKKMNLMLTPLILLDKILGGPRKPEKLIGKRWYQIYSTTLVMLVTVLLIGVLPEAVDAINGLPDPEALEKLSVRIVEIRKTEPHLFVEHADGIRRDMEWPVPISFHGNFRTHIWSDAEREALPGCRAVVRGEALRYTVQARYRIWSLDCPEKDIHIGFDKSKKQYLNWVSMRARSFHWLPMILWIPWLLLILIVFLKEKRGTL